jgi:hypothetical protein
MWVSFRKSNPGVPKRWVATKSWIFDDSYRKNQSIKLTEGNAKLS